MKEKDNIRKHDRNWVFTFFGTAIGAGILFLPVQTATSGLFIVAISMVLAYIATYYSQKYFAVFIVRAENPESFDAALVSYWGKIAGIGITLFWAITFISPLTIYTTATCANFAQFVVDYSPIPLKLFGNPLLSLAFVVICTVLLLCSDKYIIAFCDKISNVLLYLLVILVILFIPFWKFPSGLLTFDWTPSVMLKNLLMSFPLFNGALVFYMTIPPMIMFYCKYYGNMTPEEKEAKCVFLNKKAMILVTVFTTVFLLSASMTLSTSDAEYALKNNVSALAILGMGKQLTTIHYIMKLAGYLVIFFALVTSFFGQALGAIAMWSHLIPFPKEWSDVKKRNVATIILMTIIWLFSALNLNILNIMGFFSSPINAIISFIIPTVIIFTSERLRKYRKFSVAFVLLVGLFTLVSYFIGAKM